MIIHLTGNEMDEFTKFLTVLAPTAFVGLIVWVWTLWRSHGNLKQELADLRVDIAQNHPTKHDMEERKQWELRMEHHLNEMRSLLVEIKTRIDIGELRNDTAG